MAQQVQRQAGETFSPFEYNPTTHDLSLIRKASYGTIGVFVHRQNSLGVFALTAGHCFRDAEDNRVDPTNHSVKWVGNLVEPLIVSATAVVPYYWAKDANNQVDAGLWALEPNLQWSNQYKIRIQDPKKNITALNVTLTDWEQAWPPAPLGNGEKYMVGAVTMPPAHQYAQFQSVITYEGPKGNLKGSPSLFKNILAFPVTPSVPGTPSISPGMSGRALVRVHANGTTATVVGLLVGRSTLSGDATKKNYDIFQHISVAIQTLGLTGLA